MEALNGEYGSQHEALADTTKLTGRVSNCNPWINNQPHCMAGYQFQVSNSAFRPQIQVGSLWARL